MVDKEYQLATFAGGCFWCMVQPFQKLKGIIKVVSGYTGGNKDNPTYEEVCSKNTGHFESIQITFDPEIVSYDELLKIYWRQIDPTDMDGQFFDRGLSYKTAIFYHSQEQRQKAEKSKEALAESNTFKKPVVTEILPAKKFFPAEEYHQDYHIKNPEEYNRYRKTSGRDPFLVKHWDREKNRDCLRSKLTDLQYEVTIKNGTEQPFKNEYWDNHREGIYVDIISGAPLFSSTDKYDSGTGWPSFLKPLKAGEVEEKPDLSHSRRRTEVRSANSDAHLGHVFNDGPAPLGLRYCINSAALRFIPREEMKKEGYGEYLHIFKDTGYVEGKD